MAKKHLVRLLFELSQDAALKKRYRQDAEAVMREHRLSAKEKGLLRKGDRREVAAYLGTAWPAGPTVVKTLTAGPTVVKTARTGAKKARKPKKTKR